jgi:hypothetical protein
VFYNIKINLTTMTTVQTIQGLKDAVESLFRSLQVIEHQLTQQELEIELRREELVKMTDTNDQLAVNMRATRTTVALLREEVEEFDMMLMELLKTSKHES